MKFELFLNFNDGMARAAAEFYAAVFRSSVKDAMSFGEAPADPNYPVADAERDRLMYATVKIGDKDIMFMDMSAGFPVAMGNNITLCVTLSDHAEIDRIAAELGAGGNIIMAPQKVWFSEYYAMVADKFGITWHVYVGE
ncbi:MAG: VOC family protein [Rickettsiales bacterium]|jgi:PhnB protein|nr:VOC family protein [Rickettsiales bacterium]